MKLIILKQSLLTLPLFLLSILLLSSTASATGPRVTKALFAIDKSEIHALDFPPFLSAEVTDGGAFSEVVNMALQQAGIDAVISAHPVQRMVKYYLLQENALAVMGRHLNFSSEEMQQLIHIPLSVQVEKYYYYKPAYPNGLNWNGRLDSLKGKIYGAHKGENVAAYKKADVSVKRGRTTKLLKMIAAGKVDFAAIPALTADWLLTKYMAGEKDNFAAMDIQAGDSVFFIFFNKGHPQGEASAAAFKKALTSMVKDGRYAEIMKKYLGNDGVLEFHMEKMNRLLAK